jgi:hypothetical protein
MEVSKYYQVFGGHRLTTRIIRQGALVGKLTYDIY